MSIRLVFLETVEFTDDRTTAGVGPKTGILVKIPWLMILFPITPRQWRAIDAPLIRFFHYLIGHPLHNFWKNCLGHARSRI